MTRPAPLAAVLAAVVLLGGCSGGAQEQSEQPERPAAPSASPEPPGVRIGAPAWTTRTSGSEIPELQAAGEEVLVVQDLRGGGEGSVQVLDADSGSRLWRLPSRVEDDDTSGTDHVLVGVGLGSDADGREIVTVPDERYTCREAGDCTFRAGIEARDARTGRVRWRWSSGEDDADGLVLGAQVTPEAVMVPRRGGVLGLDPMTGERRWWADVNPPGLVDDGVGISGPVAAQDEPYRVLDLTTGEVVRTLDAGQVPLGLVGEVMARGGDGRIVLEDVRTGEPHGVVGDDDVPPLQLGSHGGSAWLTSDDRLLTLLPGETEPVAAHAPTELDRADLLLGSFAGDVAGGVLVVRTDDGVRTVSRHGAVDDRVGPEALTVRTVAGGRVVLQVGGEPVGPAPPVEVRPIR